MATVTEHLTESRALLDAITGDLDEMLRNAELDDVPEQIEEEPEYEDKPRWHSC